MGKCVNAALCLCLSCSATAAALGQRGVQLDAQVRLRPSQPTTKKDSAAASRGQDPAQATTVPSEVTSLAAALEEMRSVLSTALARINLCIQVCAFVIIPVSELR